jgi:hypothetical protein
MSHFLDELVIGNPYRATSLFDGQDPRTRDFRLEMLDATYEDANGRLPHEPGYIEPQPHARPATVHQLAPRRRTASGRAARREDLAA